MARKIIILGVTGSIGESSLDIIRKYPHLFQIAGFSYHNNFEKAARIQKEFQVPNIACTGKHIGQEEIHHWKDENIHFFDNMDDLLEIDYDIIITGIVGSIGIRPTLKAIYQNKTILLANKETLVMAGDLVMDALKKSSARILPVDSEHSSVFRLLENRNPDGARIILTASGGALREFTGSQIKKANRSDVLHHPTWSMGEKITVDSAGMVNKALEVIEAHHLFSVPYSRIDAVIHPQSYIHAMVQWMDGSFSLHVSKPSMMYPIAHALFHPEPAPEILPPVMPDHLPAFDFHPIDREKYPGYYLGLEAGKKGSRYSLVFNASNEVAVERFLTGEIVFYQIPSIIEMVLQKVPASDTANIEEYENLDLWAREETRRVIAENHFNS